MEMNIHINKDDLQELKKYSDQLRSQSEQLKVLTSNINKTLAKVNQIKLRVSSSISKERD